MCGIAGLWPRTNSNTEAYVGEMLQQLRHRGPDGQGIWSDPHDTVVLGHRRLAIIDLSDAGNQPMISTDGSLALVFNGEIYNYPTLRSELEAQGKVFRSTSDTETVLLGYELWGLAVLERLVGMFAFALWDGKAKQLLLARDRSGEKPLYYANSTTGFAFGSEIGSLATLPWVRREIDQQAVALYLAYQYVPAPYSIYKDIRKLPPAHAMVVNESGLKTWRYWDPVSFLTMPRLQISRNEALEQSEQLLRQAVRGQLMSDVPLGAFLSGGIDSSTVVSFMAEMSNQPVRTFTIGFEVPGYNEAEYAAAVAKHLGTDHTTDYLTEKDALELVPRVPGMFGEPFADSSALPTYLVSAVARKYVTVSLSGDGGDEAFGGYTRYRSLLDILRWYPYVRGFSGLFSAVLPSRSGRWDILKAGSDRNVYRRFMNVFSSFDVYNLTGKRTDLVEYERSWDTIASPYRRAMLSDMLTYMPEDILVKVDRSAMAVSLETRAPLLDHRLLEFSLQLPDELVKEKQLLKELAYRRIPKGLLDRPKQGFGVPLGQWLRNDLRETVKAALEPGRLRQLGIENPSIVDRMLTEHLGGTKSHSARLWALLVLSLWGDTSHG